jgi:hypothetical protein
LDASIEPEILNFLIELEVLVAAILISILLGIFKFEVLFIFVFVFLLISPFPIKALIFGEPILPFLFGLFLLLIDYFILFLGLTFSESGLGSGEIAAC